LLFQRVPEGKSAKNQVHLDVNVSKPHGHTEQGWRLVADHVWKLTVAGATVLHQINEKTGRCVVMQDPQGNAFCVQ
jgi:predicted enzyme related to lactoylglutathione lyase